MNILKTCESVCAGHPDKICDQISDAILDACLAEDPNSRVALECLIKDNNLILAGEITSKANPDYFSIAKNTLAKIGYKKEEVEDFKIQNLIGKQSVFIAQGVDTGEAGDQGMMYGYATDETEEMIPLSLLLSHKLSKKLNDLLREDEDCPLKADGKSQVTVEYADNAKALLDVIVVSSQHKKDISNEDLEKYIFDKVIYPICAKYMKENYVINPHFKNEKQDGNFTKIYINPTGRFEIGGSYGDCGLTGRKIAVDTYGGLAKIGGGAFSGKDPSKVDRSGAYMARYLAKKILALKFASEVEVRLAYAIGVAEPVDISVEIIRGDKNRQEEIIKYIKENYDLSPNGIIKFLDLKRPIYFASSAYGHFGRAGFPWEEV
jgi:S-adenosylmethionine synthetase